MLQKPEKGKVQQDQIDACVKLYDEARDGIAATGREMADLLIKEYERTKELSPETVAKFEAMAPLERIVAWSKCTENSNHLDRARTFHKHLASSVLSVFGGEALSEEDRNLLIGMQHTKRFVR